MPLLMISGFEPFDGYSINPSAELAKALDGKRIGLYEIAGLVLPLDYDTAHEILMKEVEEQSPEIVLCTGQASRPAITLERIAINAQSVTRQDNYGNLPESDVIDASGPVGYFTTIDPHPLVAELEKVGIPAFVSYHAGIYGCNWLIFNVMRQIHEKNLDLKATFIHVPPLPFQAIERSNQYLATMPLETLVSAFETIIQNLP
ncbi:MAG: pyroglutamyl-peptidase I [Candidatus Thorarchaeota archaeon]